MNEILQKKICTKQNEWCRQYLKIDLLAAEKRHVVFLVSDQNDKSFLGDFFDDLLDCFAKRGIKLLCRLVEQEQRRFF